MATAKAHNYSQMILPPISLDDQLGEHPGCSCWKQAGTFSWSRSISDRVMCV